MNKIYVWQRFYFCYFKFDYCNFCRNMAVRCRRWTWWRIVRCRSWQVARGRRHPQDRRRPRLRPRRPPYRRRAWGNDRAPCCAPKSRWLGSYAVNSSPELMLSVRTLMAAKVKFFLSHFSNLILFLNLLRKAYDNYIWHIWWYIFFFSIRCERQSGHSVAR